MALDEVSVGFAPGEVTPLIGKNGAGKSTLVKILAGSVAPSRGRILCDGVPVALRAPQDAFDYGIAMVYQELSLVPGLTVAENILLGRTPKRRGFIDWAGNLRTGRGCSREARSRHRRPGTHRRFRGWRSSRSSRSPRPCPFDPAVLILDEPTSALATHETEQLFRVVKGLAAADVAIIYISHRLQELHSIGRPSYGAARRTSHRHGGDAGTRASRR